MSIHDATTHLFLQAAREQELADRAAEIRLRESLDLAPRRSRPARAEKAQLARHGLRAVHRWARQVAVRPAATEERTRVAR